MTIPMVPRMLPSFALALAVSACGGGLAGEAPGAAATDGAALAIHGPRQEVVATGDPAVDVPAVQAAVSAGGQVTLSGTFDFGPSGQVLISRDVEIRGRHGATVKGGFLPFNSPLPALPLAAPGPAIAIRGLVFDGALRAAINLVHARAVDVRGNVIRNVKPLVTPPNPAVPVPGFRLQAGIILGTYYAYRPAVLPGVFTGQVTVSGNDLEMTGDAPAQTLCQGILLTRGWGVRARITENRIGGCSRNAIEVLDNFLDEAGYGRIEIAENLIHAPAVGVPFPTGNRPNGIIAGWFFEPGGAIDPARNAPFRIAENEITCDGQFSTGIFANTAGVALLENRIAVGGTGAFGIVLSSPGGRAAGNRISGSGIAAVNLYPYFPAIPALTPSANRLSCNAVAGFTASVADLVLSGNDNRVSGFTGTVLDRGTGNQFLPGGDCDDD